MRKILFILMMLLPVVANAKEYNLYCEVDGKSTGGAFYENDSVRFDFEYHAYSPHFITVKIRNKTKGRIMVEWENTRLSDAQICFGTDNSFSLGNPKPDEVIHAYSYTIKEIGERTQPKYMSLIFSERLMKEFGESANSVIIPIRYPSGRVEDIEIYLVLEYKK